MAKVAPSTRQQGVASTADEQYRLLTVITPLWNQAGRLCGCAPICQRRAEWKQIEQTALECEARIASLWK